MLLFFLLRLLTNGAKSRMAATNEADARTTAIL